MQDTHKRDRETKTIRINLEGEAFDLVKALAARRHISTATMIGTIIESYVYSTERSTA